MRVNTVLKYEQRPDPGDNYPTLWAMVIAAPTSGGAPFIYMQEWPEGAHAPVMSLWTGTVEQWDNTVEVTDPLWTAYDPQLIQVD